MAASNIFHKEGVFTSLVVEWGDTFGSSVDLKIKKRKINGFD